MNESPLHDSPAQQHPLGRNRIGLLVVLATVGVLLIASATAAGTVLLVGSGQSAVAKAIPAVAVSTAGFPTGGTNPGIFTDTCRRGLTAPNDPILMPGMTGKSMQHDFFGNLTPTSTSIPARLIGGATNCSTTADSSGYWTPVLYQNGIAMEPKATLIYWRAPAASASAVATMPAGMTMIAGNEAASTPQDPRVIGWTCSISAAIAANGGATGAVATQTSLPRDCPTGEYLRLVVTFPNCWDGHTLDGHAQQNVVYQIGNKGCPTSHPVQIPQVVVHINYPTSSAANLTLSVGPTQRGSVLTGHADFMDGWNQATMDRDVKACITSQTRCGPVIGPLATPLGGKSRT